MKSHPKVLSFIMKYKNKPFSPSSYDWDHLCLENYIIKYFKFNLWTLPIFGKSQLGYGNEWLKLFK